jgi:hypothetical protein
VPRLNQDLGDRLNFYPYYQELLKRRLKTKSIRLGDESRKYKKGKLFTLTCGWTEKEAVALGMARALKVTVAPIKSLKDSDLRGESPDCLNAAAVPYVLSAIYRKVVTDLDQVTVIQWEFVE